MVSALRRLDLPTELLPNREQCPRQLTTGFCDGAARRGPAVADSPRAPVSVRPSAGKMRLVTSRKLVGLPSSWHFEAVTVHGFFQRIGVTKLFARYSYVAADAIVTA